ncbi:MarR family winged helix-turn-helix transcriptional regulator [Jiella sp. M17.18]|uniref:MarR family winged helix-turn-helix transcriptional regulator n=1 Tax=Jiella sp. M17.18 TaxID=3234247 RepID=UPI0034DE8FE2
MPQLLPSNSLGFLIVDVARLFRQEFEHAVVEAGVELTPGELRALAHVARFKGARQAVLAERMGVEPMTLSAYLDRLESRGLVTRATDPNDRRAKVVNPTDAAEVVFENTRPIAAKVFERITDGFTDEERDTVRALLTRMRANLTKDPYILGDAAAA